MSTAAHSAAHSGFHSDDDEDSPIGTPPESSVTQDSVARISMPLLTGSIEIMDATKVTEMGSSFVVYCIKVGGKDAIVKRRYSEFESIRKILKRLYPHVVVPPIPEKHSLADYAKLQKKVKDDQHTIDVRKRMLQSFLNRVATHAVLGKEQLFHRFLEEGAWTDVLASQNISKRDKRDVTTPTGSSAPLLGLKKLKNPDLKFLDVESHVDQLTDALHSMEKDNKKITKRVSELSALYSELGAVFNAFSLHETANQKVASGIEKVGQAMDSSYLGTNALLRDLEEQIVDQFHEFVQFCDSAKNVLRARHQKHAHYEDLGDQLDNRRVQLSNLEKEPVASLPLQTSTSASGSTGGLGKRMLSGIGSLGDKLHNIVDSDPELTRRTHIARLKDIISTLEKEREEAHAELIKYSEQVQESIERFHAQMIRDLKQLLLAYAKMQQKWHEKNLTGWKDALTEVEKI